MRTEKDSMGEMSVPDDALWGASTQRAVLNFPISGRPLPTAFIRSLGLVKSVAASVNSELGRLPPVKAELIRRAAREVAEGKLDDHFPVDVFQTGSGTSTNMNANEVIARRAAQLAQKTGVVHPNDDVNLGQSSNDIIPTVLHVSLARALRDDLQPALQRLHTALTQKQRAFDAVVKIGRTHLMDATPLTLGQEFSGYAAQIRKASARVDRAIAALGELAIGGTAVGTGLNSHPEFGERAAKRIAELTGLPFASHPNKFAALSAHDEFVFASGALKTLAGSLMKIANDIRWLGSGPRCGLRELQLPENEPGSSIMPGKVNPTQSEAMTMVAVQVLGNDVTIGIAGSQGNFELNVFNPVMVYNFLNSVRLLADTMNSFASHCLEGLTVNRDVVARYLEISLMNVTALNPHIGYEKAAAIAKKAQKEGTSLKEAALALGHLTAEQFDQWVNPERMTRP
ncbi:MAG: class II fumarate hydratase [Verrucomicrobiae bacterium]|nr:class II fumarate hydratase [Verrucomicrobiae bacterium]